MDNSYAEFKKTGKIVADFNIGGKRVSRAILNFENVGEETLCMLGIILGKTYLQTFSTNALHKIHADDAEYQAACQKLADSLSGKEIDMSEYCPDKADWSFAKGVSKPKQSLEDQLIAEDKAGKIDKARLAALEALLKSIK